MEDIRSIYYSKFLSLVVSQYESQIKGAKPGHCMKIEGLPLSEMQKLIRLTMTDTFMDTALLPVERNTAAPALYMARKGKDSAVMVK